MPDGDACTAMRSRAHACREFKQQSCGGSLEDIDGLDCLGTRGLWQRMFRSRRVVGNPEQAETTGSRRWSRPLASRSRSPRLRTSLSRKMLIAGDGVALLTSAVACHESRVLCGPMDRPTWILADRPR